jgi:hypothetical protein
MIRADEIRNDDNQIRFALSALEIRPLRAKTRVRAGAAVRAIEPYELNLSGSQLLVGSLSALCTVGLLLWAVLKLWLGGR